MWTISSRFIIDCGVWESYLDQFPPISTDECTVTTRGQGVIDAHPLATPTFCVTTTTVESEMMHTVSRWQWRCSRSVALADQRMAENNIPEVLLGFESLTTQEEE